MTNKKELIKTIAIIILIIVILGIFLVPSYNQAIYNKGFTDGTINIIQTQIQTGNVFVINNGTIESYPVCSFCGGGGWKLKQNIYKYINIIYSMSFEKIRCKKCDSTQTYIRQKTNERVCKVCGHVEKIEIDGGNN